MVFERERTPTGQTGGSHGMSDGDRVYTADDLCMLIGLSRPLLARIVQAGIVAPRRQNGVEIYTQADVATLQRTLYLVEEKRMTLDLVALLMRVEAHLNGARIAPAPSSRRADDGRETGETKDGS